MIATGIWLVVGGLLPAKVAAHYATGLSFEPASNEYVLFTLGLSVLCLGLLHGWVDGQQWDAGGGVVEKFFRRFSFFSLTVYLVHLAVHIWPLWIYGASMGNQDVTHYYQRAMSTPWALGLSVVCIVAFSAVLPLLERRPKYSFEYCMRWICG